ncbi:E3 ubiquitin-protein ligase TRIM7-like [Anolis sagrei]|uniref:E3 ubiquitin-protein ligase TRIM7-like n=1 Tax=Anolis sagrei TaxID=38937 RepID=UPI003521E4D3
MAAAAARDPVKDLCEEATCSFCLVYFKDPVSLECGHNFCRDCVIQCWEKSGTTETSCPQCKERVLQSNLRPNPSLANVVKIAKKLSLQTPRRTEGRERVCEKHQEPLNIFCEDDETFICVLCDRSKEHGDYRVIPLSPAARDYKVDLTASAPEDPVAEEVTCSVCLEYFKDPVTLECGHNFCRSCVTQSWEKSVTKETTCPQCREKVQQKNLKSNWQLANIIEITKKRPQGQKRAEGKERVCEKHQEPLKLFCKDDETPICLVCDKSKEHKDHTVIPVEEAAQDYKDLMGNHQAILEKQKEKILVYKAETKNEFQDHLKQTEADMENILGEITEARRFLEEQENQLRAQMEELRKQTAKERDENLAMFDQELSSLKNLIQELKEKCQQPPVELLQDVKNLLQRSQEKKTFEKPAAFSKELKFKTWELYDLKSSLVPVMKQFQGREGFTRGRHFWDVAVESEEGWFVGVAKKSARRQSSIGICAEEGFWAVSSWGGSYRTTSGSEFFLSEKVKRVRVYLNCTANSVAFYNADTEIEGETSKMSSRRGLSLAVLPLPGAFGNPLEGGTALRRRPGVGEKTL